MEQKELHFDDEESDFYSKESVLKKFLNDFYSVLFYSNAAFRSSSSPSLPINTILIIQYN